MCSDIDLVQKHAAEVAERYIEEIVSALTFVVVEKARNYTRRIEEDKLSGKSEADTYFETDVGPIIDELDKWTNEQH